MVQKKTGSGTSTPDRTTLAYSAAAPPPSRARRAAAAAAEAFDETISAGVNPEEHQRTSLLVMENLEGQSTEVAVVPPPAGRGHNGQSSVENDFKTTSKRH
ncbi:hypothetical protein EYF80_063984 [Liparis tanakae]|uniref:Uncharacterized protein n=1 Tax=Liparis tanakae TaxID=230148 RepID=A0A4Z2EBE5_9TELE|nr:hypothetical protein EYF80_063984 [Liparis tanakae]